MPADEETGGCEPCFAHQLVGGQPVDPDTWRDVARFRRAERTRLLAKRKLSISDRQAATRSLIRVLGDVVAFIPGTALAVYWPIRGEPDLRTWMADAHAAGVQVLLPVVVTKDAPLEFHCWSPGCSMTRGLWNIPVPADGAAATLMWWSLRWWEQTRTCSDWATVAATMIAPSPTLIRCQE